jgi:anti-sigma regulatory factor (Ser/Thr protein kinase)/biotin operon repressor
VEQQNRGPMNLKRRLIELIAANKSGIGSLAAKEFGLSRQTVNRELRRLAAEGLIKQSGQTRGRHYTLPLIANLSEMFDIAPGLSEDAVWRQKVAPLMTDLPNNVQYICQHGFTEIFNNALDHSESPKVSINVTRTASSIMMIVSDAGIGVFKKIQDFYHLEDARHAILELTKGKLTTDHQHHSGEGIFFTSRLFDFFSIYSDDLALLSVPSKHDWLMEIENRQRTQGTIVLMNISVFSERTFREVADKFASGEHDYGFSKTCIPLNLAKFGIEQLVSRSQAKRVLLRANRFKEVVLDFSNVETIGQGFADEIFGVFEREHPDVQLIIANANPEVDGMIKHVREARSEQEAEIKTTVPFLPGLEPEKKGFDRRARESDSARLKTNCAAQRVSAGGAK